MRKWWGGLLIVLLVAALAHGINMFHFPYYEDDEGTYMSQAWALTNLGKLTPYIYTYDHAPMGWILIGAWTKLTGGFFTFGFSINSGRVLMQILQLASTVFVYFIMQKLFKNRATSLLAALLFSISPLGIYFQRRVLLDNIMIFWILLSLLLLLNKNNLKNLLISAFVFGIAIVTKETALVFLPIFLYLAFVLNKQRRWRLMVSWLAVSMIPVIIYLGYPVLRGEFLPSTQHASFIGTWILQFKRTGGFGQSLTTWLTSDPIFILLGLITTLFNLIFQFNQIRYRIIALFSIIYIFFIIKGGLILEFYILPLIPFLAMNMAATIYYLNKRLKIKPLLFYFPIFIFFIINLLFFGSRSKTAFNLYTSDQTTPQIEAVDWILSQNNPNAFYVIDNYAYIELQSKKDQHLKNAEYYWKVDTDPQVIKVLNNDWKNISFLAVTPQMTSDLESNHLPLTQMAFNNSSLITQFYKDKWGVKIYQVNSKQ
jgi:4-amino-4-deoxy-L-arabinose transferase-like glycosyltransferase